MLPLRNWEPLNEECLKDLLYEMIYLKTWKINDPQLFEDIITFCTKHYGMKDGNNAERKEFNELCDRTDDAWKDMYYG